MLSFSVQFSVVSPMIVYDLKCRRGHVFEGWFAGSAAFERQVKAGSVHCPECGSAKVTKAPMAPRLSRGAEAPAAPAPAPAAQPAADKGAEVLRQLRQHVEKNFDYVGKEFAEEARRIHYREADARNIYGEATEKESADLREEGIDFGSMPWPRHDA
jgi:hypothetical protein